MNTRCDHLYSEGGSGSFEWVQVQLGKWRRCRVEQQGHAVDVRRDLLEQFNPLPGHRALHDDETGDVATRPRKARDEAAGDWIGDLRKNDRDGSRLLQQSRRVGRTVGKNEVGTRRDKFPRESLSQFRVAGHRPARVDTDIAALGPAELLKFVPERGNVGLSSGLLSAYAIRAPIRRTTSVCCAGAPSGHAAAAPPISMMNSRRLMGHPCRRAHPTTSWSKGRVVRHSKFDPLMTGLGQPLPSQDFCGTAAFPLKPDIARRGWHGRKVP